MRGKRTGKPQIPPRGHVLFRKRDHVFHIGEWVNGFTNPAGTFLPRGGTSMVVYKYIWYLYYIGIAGHAEFQWHLQFRCNNRPAFTSTFTARRRLALHDVSTCSDRRCRRNGHPKIANRIDKYYRFKND